MDKMYVKHNNQDQDRDDSNPKVFYDDMYKILLVGAPSVGKSALVHRFCADNFVLEHNPTIGIDLKVRDIELNGHKIKLKLWDTSGEERFHKVVNAHCRGSEAGGVIIVFDISDLGSFNAAKKWIAILSELASSNASSRGWNPVKILVGNKEDLLLKRAVSKFSGEQLAIENKFLYVETSAKTGLNVSQCFYKMSSSIKHRKDNETFEQQKEGEYRKYGPNLLECSPDTQDKVQKMNRVILEFEHKQNINGTFSTDPSKVEVSDCCCIPLRKSHNFGRNALCVIL